MNSIELFSGGGGLAIGLLRAGFNHKLLVESCPHAVQTLRHNFRIASKAGNCDSIKHADVRSFNFEELTEDICVIAGGPPCQPFSQAGRLRGFSDERNMFPSAIAAVRTLKPKAFIFENVRGLLRNCFNDHLEYIRLQLTYPEATVGSSESEEEHYLRLQDYHISGHVFGTSYNVIIVCANAADYGVPQKRDRVFIIGFLQQIHAHWNFPQKTHSKERLLWEKWISGEYWDKFQVPKNQRLKAPKELERRISLLKDSGAPKTKAWLTIRGALKDIPHPKKLDRNYLNHEFRSGAKVYKGHSGSPIDEPSKTIKAGVHGVPGGENIIRYPNGTVRYMTIREIARIQGFPDNYEFISNWTDSTRLLGNAVPVQLATAVAKSVFSALSRSKTTI